MAGNSINSYSFIEPLGHEYYQTKIERYWASFWGPFALNRSRILEYDINSNMTFAPLQYNLKRFDISDSLPSDEWIIESFLSLVRAEFSHTQRQFPENWPVIINKTIYVNDDFLNVISANSESVIYIDKKENDDHSAKQVAEDVYELLCNINIGDKANRINVDKRKFVDRLIEDLAENKRLLFVLPGFPFKDQNRFRVPFGADVPDMAEISFMLRLYRLTQSLYQVHPYGADVVVLTDGELYADIFEVEKFDVDKYHERLIQYRNKLNLQATVSFVSIKEMINRANEAGVIDKIINHIAEKLRVFAKNNKDEFYKSFCTLKQGMKWNLNSKKEHFDIDDEICWDLLCSSRESILPQYYKFWDEVDSKATEIAIKYAATNLMLKHTSLIQCFFPNSIRGTVHAKKDQFALAGRSSYAWNGIAWSKEWPQTIDDFCIKSFKDLNGESIVNQVICNNSGLPLFFTSSDYKINILNAKKAFPMKTHSLEMLQIKPFCISDIDALENIGKNDPNFNWIRENQSSEYYEKLLNFRMEHYRKYGFGVYGIWINEELIGQVGLQVLDYELDQVEWVVFLGENYTGKGIGTILLNYLVGSCRKNGMDTLFSVVRPENTAGVAITKKFGGVTVSNIVHYEKNGIKFRINLLKVV